MGDNKLNPILFNEDNILRPVVKEKILTIVDLFVEYTQIDIRILDIRLVGSNAAYNYTSTSDIDVHIVTDLATISDPEIIARLYLDSVKKNFNDSYDIKIKGIDVEIYVEDVNVSSVSNGIYSITKDKWIKEPVESVEPTAEELKKAEEIVTDIIKNIKKSNDYEEIQNIIDDLYIMRKDGLSSEGETSPGNLAFKILRNKGILDKVKQIMRDSTSKELSLESKKIDELGEPLVPDYEEGNPE